MKNIIGSKSKGGVWTVTEEMLLVKKAQKGDVKAFEALMDEYFKKIYNIAFRMTNNADDAADITQEIMIKLFKNIASFKGDSKFSTWVYRVATNTCLDELKKIRRNSHTSINAEYDMPDTQPTPEQYIEKKELSGMVAKAIEKLSAEHRAAIVLRDIRGFSYEEIAAVFKCSVGTVKSRISRARGQLKNILEKDFNFGGTYFKD